MSWQEDVIPENFMVESQGQVISAREHPFFKNAPDVPTFLKSAFDNHREVNARLPMPNGDDDLSKWETAVNEKLKDRGYSVIKSDAMPKPGPAEYTVTKPENIPAEAWSQELEGEAKAWAKKHGLSQEALNEGMGLYLKTLGTFGQAVEVNRKAMAEKVKTWADQNGVSVDEMDAALDRFNKDPNGWDAETAELISKSGWGDHPLVVQAIYKLMKDSGSFDVRGDAGSSPTEVQNARQEIDAIRNDPNHPMYKRFQEGDAEVGMYVTNLYKKITGGAKLPQD